MESARFITVLIYLLNKNLFSAYIVLQVPWHCPDAKNIQMIFLFMEPTVWKATEKCKWLYNIWLSESPETGSTVTVHIKPPKKSSVEVKCTEVNQILEAKGCCGPKDKNLIWWPTLAKSLPCGRPLAKDGLILFRLTQTLF